LQYLQPGWLALLIALLFMALIYLLWRHLRLMGRVESRARELFERWSRAEADGRARMLFEEWRRREEKKIREDAIKQSEAVIKGKVTEHLLPFFPGFKYNPKDARFIGTPVDLIVFDGLGESDLRRIVFLEVKTGRAGTLSPRERLVRRCIEEGRVGYEVLHHRGEANERGAGQEKT
jgi:predicted Holliday junction resolvase-like endonuclease